ncbi:HGxxPAAW family protein [Kineococcus gynurae]|uniref:HGxxPAAW family protein n=1 Tax=Kineococcus gynurae TaxID=452979 RepID=A0ABV5LQF7_9ACTN
MSSQSTSGSSTSHAGSNGPGSNAQAVGDGPDGHGHDELGHGHSIAAWAGVTTCLVGFLILSLAVVFPSLTWGIIGGVVIVASMVVGGVLAKMGYGVKGKNTR